MSPITRHLTPCVPDHFDLLPYHKGLETLPYHYVTDRSYHMTSTYLVTWLLLQAVLNHTKNMTKAF